jgi:hypothetical protein
MNERIKELAEQSGLKYYNWITNESNINDGTFKYPRLEDYERFAELIVRECISISTNVGKNPYIPDGDQAKKIIRELKQHFGIKE